MFEFSSLGVHKLFFYTRHCFVRSLEAGMEPFSTLHFCQISRMAALTKPLSCYLTP